MFDLNDLARSPEHEAEMSRVLQLVKDRLEAAKIDYKFMFQMLGDKVDMPTADAVSIIAAGRIAEHMRAWDGDDPILPVMFGVLMVREALSND